MRFFEAGDLDAISSGEATLVCGYGHEQTAENRCTDPKTGKSRCRLCKNRLARESNARRYTKRSQLQREKSADERALLRIEESTCWEPTSGCRLWLGNVSSGRGGPYGTMSFRGRTWRVHRVVYVLAHGAIPVGTEIDHVRARGCSSTLCCNIGHLEAVTHANNIRRGRAAETRRALGAQATHCANGHERSAENTYVRVDARGRTFRNCRVCGRMRRRGESPRKAAAS